MPRLSDEELTRFSRMWANVNECGGPPWHRQKEFNAFAWEALPKLINEAAILKAENAQLLTKLADKA